MATISVVRSPHHTVRRRSLPLAAQHLFRSNYAGTNDARRRQIASDFTSAGIRTHLRHVNNFDGKQVDFAPTATGRNWSGNATNQEGLDAAIKLIPRNGAGALNPNYTSTVNGDRLTFDTGRAKSNVDFMREYDPAASIGLILYDFPASIRDDLGTDSSGSPARPSRECWGLDSDAAARGVPKGMASLFLELWNRYGGAAEGRISVVSYGQERKGWNGGTRQTRFGGVSSTSYGGSSLNNFRDIVDGFTLFAKRVRAALGAAAPELWAFHLDAFALGTDATDIDNLLAGGNSLGSGAADQAFQEAFARMGRDVSGLALNDYTTTPPFDPTLLPDAITIDLSIASSGRFRSGTATTDYDNRRSRTRIAKEAARVLDAWMTAAWGPFAVAAGLPANAYNVGSIIVELYEDWSLSGDTLNADAVGQGALLGSMSMQNVDSPYITGESRWEPSADSNTPEQCWITPYDITTGAALANPAIQYFPAWAFEKLIDTTFPVGAQAWAVTPDATDDDVEVIAANDVALVANKSRTATKTANLVVDGVPLAPISLAPRTYQTVALPAAGPTFYAKDDFTRTLAGQWGSADVGGPYSTTGGATTDYNVDGATGTIAVIAAGSRNARLTSVSAQDVTGTFRAKIDKLPAAGNVQLQQWVRRSADALNDYRVKLMIAAAVGGSSPLTIGFSRRSNGSAETTVAAFVTPTAKASIAAGEYVRVRFRVANEAAGVATVQIRVWGDADPEPSTWDVNTTNAQPENQIAGHTQLFVFASAAVSNAITGAPIVAAFDGLALTPAFEFQRTDAGVGADSSAPVIVNGTNVAAVDAAAGADVAIAPTASSSRSDTGAGADSSSEAATPAASAEAAAGVDAIATRANGQADTATSSDVSSIAAAAVATDVGAGAEASSTSASASSTDAGVGADLTEDLTAVGILLRSDDGVGVDDVATRSAELLEAGAGAEASGSLAAASAATDLAAGDDAAAGSATASAADIGDSVDLSSGSATFVVADIGAVDDRSSRDVSQTFDLTDVGVGVDVATPARGYGRVIPAVFATASVSIDITKRGRVDVAITRVR